MSTSNWSIAFNRAVKAKELKHNISFYLYVGMLFFLLSIKQPKYI